MSTNHRYHWLILRDDAGLAAYSQSLHKSSHTGSTEPGLDNVVLTIDGLTAPLKAKVVRVLRPSGMPKQALHAKMLTDHFESGEAAVSWAKMPDSAKFFVGHIDAFIIAVPN